MGVSASEVAGLAITGSWILSFTFRQLVCVFLLVRWSRTLKSLLRTLFQFSEFPLCYPDSCFLFSSFPPLVSQASLSQHYGFRHCSAFLIFFPESSFISVLFCLRLSSFVMSVAPASVYSGVWRPWKALVCACLQMSPFPLSTFKGCFPAYSHLDVLSGHKHIVSHFPCFCDSWGESSSIFGVLFSTDNKTFNIVCLFASYFWCFEYVIDYSWLYLSGVSNISYIWMSIYFSIFFNFLLLLFHGICPRFLISFYSSHL